MDQKYSRLNQWYRQPLGQMVAANICQQLEPLISNLFGYHIVQVGVPDIEQWIIHSPIPHKVIISDDKTAKSDLVASASQLPLKTDSIDTVILPHTLEYAKDPKRVLAEMNRILMPEGNIILFGFNSFSLWGLAKRCLSWRKVAPWQGHFHSTWRMYRYLAEYEFEVVRTKTFYYRPPFSDMRKTKKSIYLETFGKILWPYPGGIYMIVAKKRASTMMPIRPIWSFRSFVVGKRFVQTRVQSSIKE